MLLEQADLVFAPAAFLRSTHGDPIYSAITDSLRDYIIHMRTSTLYSRILMSHYCGPLSVCFAAALIAIGYSGSAKANVLACTSEEASTLAQAPHGALRAAPHTLRVNFRNGPKTFVDLAPYIMDTLDGLVWRYCGYDPETKIHLIEKLYGGHSGGVIVREDNGQIAQAGFALHIAPDKRNFLAAEQEDGMYGELWTWRDLSGHIVWRGRAMLMQGTRITALLNRPNWNDRGELTAHFVCENELLNPTSPTNHQAMLIRFGPHWVWRADEAKVCELPP